MGGGGREPYMVSQPGGSLVPAGKLGLTEGFKRSLYADISANDKFGLIA